MLENAILEAAALAGGRQKHPKRSTDKAALGRIRRTPSKAVSENEFCAPDELCSLGGEIV